ncbi:hypothetical protein RJ639_010210 [Escallonia herrerae]|uniref:DUF4408 domain-containing protein n=1 Tax=Escallonia herrerae TaxID=1293975 RepID=A0AA89ASU2_9ASTE|nr:hypothetical protein RJ639_010210 [Escallonia herrerae]
MDSLKIQKIQAINRYKKQQLVNTLILYSLTTAACSLYCCSPFWYPPLCATVNAFLSVSLPNICSLLFGPKALFILGNLIVIFLVGESKMFKSDASSYADICYHENRSGSLGNHSQDKDVKRLEKTFVKKVRNGHGQKGYREAEKTKMEKQKQEDVQGEALSLPTEEFNKMADDFIARVNRQRRLEAIQCTNQVVEEVGFWEG